VPAGNPPGSAHTIGHIERKENTHGGTHFTITDGYGNVAVVTSTIEQSFGSGVVVESKSEKGGGGRRKEGRGREGRRERREEGGEGENTHGVPTSRSLTVMGMSQ
jgi:hypothetical protein